MLCVYGYIKYMKMTSSFYFWLFKGKVSVGSKEIGIDLPSSVLFPKCIAQAWIADIVMWTKLYSIIRDILLFPSDSEFELPLVVLILYVLLNHQLV